MELLIQAKLQAKKPSLACIKGLSKNARRLFQLWDQIVIKKSGILYRQYEDPNDSSITLQQLVPESKREEVLKEMQQGVLSGHLDEIKTLARVKEHFYWPGYHNDVRDWCRRCPDCAATKSVNPKNKAPLQSVKVGSAMQMVAVDIMGVAS
jgi:hypothetical protein